MQNPSIIELNNVRYRSSDWRSSFIDRLIAEMSVLVPNHLMTKPAEFFIGSTRVRNRRNFPSAPRSGNSMSNGSPVAIEAFHLSMTLDSTSGSCTLCHPQPSICSGVVPVYSYQRRLYHVMQP